MTFAINHLESHEAAAGGQNQEVHQRQLLAVQAAQLLRREKLRRFAV